MDYHSSNQLIYYFFKTLAMRNQSLPFLYPARVSGALARAGVAQRE
jgi:hypothetical protein